MFNLVIREVILREICIYFLSTCQFNRKSRIWTDNSLFPFRLGGVACSYSLIELGHRLGIYSANDIDHPLFVFLFEQVYSLGVEGVQPFGYLGLGQWGILI